MQSPSRRYFWLTAGALVFVAYVWFVIPPNRTQQLYDRIEYGMALKDVEEILGTTKYFPSNRSGPIGCWDSPSSGIHVWFTKEGKVDYKEIWFAPPWEIMKDFARRTADKVGINWPAIRPDS
jgi:hypothetical protein